MYYFSFSMLSFALFFFFTKFLRVKHFLYKSTLPLKKPQTNKHPLPNTPPPNTRTIYS